MAFVPLVRRLAPAGACIRVNKVLTRLSRTAHYQLAGLRIASDIALPLVVAKKEDELAHGQEVSIRLGTLPSSLPGCTGRCSDAEYDGRSLLLTIPGDVRFLIRDGREILVEPMASAAESDVLAYLLGSAFGALCHQLQILPLHASAIDINGGCVAFVGTSGAGKSTLIAALASRGHQVISDDVCFIKTTAENDVVAWPGIGRIRLWEDAVAALGLNASDIQREFRGYNKFLVPTRPPASPTAHRKLLGVYEIKEPSEGKDTIIARTHGVRAIEALIPNVYRLELAEYMNLKAIIFATCAEIARQVPIYEFSRRKGFDTLPSILDQLEYHLDRL